MIGYYPNSVTDHDARFTIAINFNHNNYNYIIPSYVAILADVTLSYEIYYNIIMFLYGNYKIRDMQGQYKMILYL